MGILFAGKCVTFRSLGQRSFLNKAQLGHYIFPDLRSTEENCIAKCVIVGTVCGPTGMGAKGQDEESIWEHRSGSVG